MQQLYKQMELKSIEAQRYKTAAEVAKVRTIYVNLWSVYVAINVHLDISFVLRISFWI